VPVSVIGTFAVLLAFGFSINTLSLFGLVLAIGIVVDDAIVVVENVERHIAEGLSPLEATKAAMSEVSRPIIAITLVLVAVFGPVAFVSGLTGEFYRQFALTIAISTVISAFNSLTLSPALAAVLLKPRGAKPDLLMRAMNRLLGRFFKRFNTGFARAGDGYSRALGITMRHGAFPLDDFSQRTSKALSGPAIAAALNQKMASIQDAFVIVVTPPPVIGLGTLGGFKLQVEDRADAGPQALFAALSQALGKAYQNPALGGAFSTYQINVPQLNVDVDRVKAKRENVRLSDVFETLQVYLGSLYVNDFNRFGRTYQVVAQADAPFRSQLDDVMPLKTRNAAGEMVPLGSVINVSRSFGPD